MEVSIKLSIFDKIIHGEIDWHFLSVLMKHIRISDAILETAVIDGVLDEGVLILLRDFHEERFRSMKKCPACGEFSPPQTVFCISCGARFPHNVTEDA